LSPVFIRLDAVPSFLLSRWRAAVFEKVAVYRSKARDEFLRVS
jgi:hypothetical protein